MMYDNPGQQLDELHLFFKGEKAYRMAIVDSIKDGRPYIKFYGEDTPSLKPYKYLQSYIPTVTDKVLLARIGKSYVILGKVV